MACHLITFGIAFPILGVPWLFHGLSLQMWHSAANLSTGCSFCEHEGWPSMSKRVGVVLSWTSVFPVGCLILLWSHWCKRNQLGLDWPTQNFCDGNKNLVCKHATLMEPCGFDSVVLSFSAPAWKPKPFPLPLCLLTCSFPSDLQPFTKHRLGAHCWDSYLGGVSCSGRIVTERVSKHKGGLFQKANAAGLLNY